MGWLGIFQTSWNDQLMDERGILFVYKNEKGKVRMLVVVVRWLERLKVTQ